MEPFSCALENVTKSRLLNLFSYCIYLTWIVVLILFSVIWKLIYTVNQYVSRKRFSPSILTKSSDLLTLKAVCAPCQNVYIGQQLNWGACYKTRSYQKLVYQTTSCPEEGFKWNLECLCELLVVKTKIGGVRSGFVTVKNLMLEKNQ